MFLDDTKVVFAVYANAGLTFPEFHTENNIFITTEYATLLGLEKPPLTWTFHLCHY